jgi:hypothetical protein
MMIHVRFFGLLARHISGYDHARGMIVETQEGFTYGDLVTLLKLPLNEVGLLRVAGIIKQPEDPIFSDRQIVNG